MVNKTKLTETEQYVWEYITRELNEIANLSLTELSEVTNVSNATIVRLLKKKGYEGFSDFKHELISKNNNRLSVLENKHLTSDTRRSIIKNYQEVVRTLNMLDVKTLEEAIVTLQDAGRIILFARGPSELTAQEMLVKFQLLDQYCELHTDPNIILPISQRLTSSDLVILISLNGETKELVEAAKNCKEHGISSILLTTNGRSSLAQLASYPLVGFKTELTYFPDFEVHSRLPLSILSRILLDSYAATLGN